MISQSEILPKEKRSAVFSEDRVYRYTLDIVWDESLPLCQFIGLNPSTADEFQDDPTVRRCKAFARREDCGGLVMTNLFAFRSTDPKAMLAHPNPQGEKVRERGLVGWVCRNDIVLVSAWARCSLTIAAWGNHGAHRSRGAEVANMIANLKCLNITGAGHPQHPLYLAASSALIPFSLQMKPKRIQLRSSVSRFTAADKPKRMDSRTSRL